MGADEGKCSYCGAANSYDDTHCKACQQELSWASWVRARGQPSAAIGAAPGSFAQRTGGDVKEGLAVLPPGAFTKVVLVVAALVVMYFVVSFVGASMHQMSRQANTANVASTSQSGSITERFKQANPVLQQDQIEQREERQREAPPK